MYWSLPSAVSKYFGCRHITILKYAFRHCCYFEIFFLIDHSSKILMKFKVCIWLDSFCYVFWNKVAKYFVVAVYVLYWWTVPILKSRVGHKTNWHFKRPSQGQKRSVGGLHFTLPPSHESFIAHICHIVA